jgi:transcriptional regulator with XRE-family HTH domain
MTANNTVQSIAEDDNIAQIIAEDEYNKKIGLAIKLLRYQKKMSQRELSKCDIPSETICSEKTLRRFEQGKTSPSVYELKRLLIVLEVTIAEFESLV